ncbi:MAG: hypothetical protein M0D55_16975 [Elusimicrobiota bacterium]|nr:MAG: hypothetical protein M0D55_16975 [Elusimicrobiota bacterium]
MERLGAGAGFLGPEALREAPREPRVALSAEGLRGGGEMLPDGLVVADRARGGLELRDGFRAAPLLEQSPAEGVAVRGVRRLEYQRAADQLLGLGELESAVGERIAEVVQRGTVVGLAVEELAELGLGLADPVHLLEDRRELPARVAVLGLDGEHLAQQRDGRRALAQVVVAEREVVGDAVVLRPARAGLLERLHRLLHAAGLELVVAESQMQGRVVLERRAVAQGSRGLLEVAAAFGVGGEPRGGGGIVGPAGLQTQELRARLLEVAARGLELGDVRPQLPVVGNRQQDLAVLDDGRRRVARDLVDLPEAQAHRVRLGLVEEIARLSFSIAAG